MGERHSPGNLLGKIQTNEEREGSEGERHWYKLVNKKKRTAKTKRINAEGGKRRVGEREVGKGREGERIVYPYKHVHRKIMKDVAGNRRRKSGS